MTLSEALEQITEIHIPAGGPPVSETAARILADRINAKVKRTPRWLTGENRATFAVGVCRSDKERKALPFPVPDTKRPVLYFRLTSDGTGSLLSTTPGLLIALLEEILEHRTGEPVSRFSRGRRIIPAFHWQRPVYDFFLTQEGRIQHGLDRESYVRELARLGFTHAEVNGLAFPMALETGPKGETYPMFYTYCPALDQFVSSRLNKGLYPEYYLSANMDYLKTNARLAVKYGLTPGLLCFEPRSVPDEFFQRYPMLRGARVDHPFRSFKPRYNMTTTHPLVLEHYSDMLEKLLRAVPELGFLSVWTNDSGAGFEHTKSLYVGRNGGAYLIREWKDDDEIARLAGENAIRFFRTLRDTGRRINPDFQVITRLESFYGEHDTIWKGLEYGVEVETASLAARGWEMPYTHPLYKDNRSINAGTVYQKGFFPLEKTRMRDLKRRGSDVHYYFSAGPQAMFAPLLGIPYPVLTYERLKELHANGVTRLAHLGGTLPPNLVPYNVNHQITRCFLLDPKMDIQTEVDHLARLWAGPESAETLMDAWRFAEKAILAFPNVTPLYSTHGFTWYRLWLRPLVPDIEAIPREERAYYEDFMCTTPHNPNNVDLSRDVLFRLIQPEKAAKTVSRIDSRVWKPLDRALTLLSGNGSDPPVYDDQRVRLAALKCWLTTQRNTAAWVAGVYGFLNSRSAGEKRRHRKRIAEFIENEIANTRSLISLLDTGVEFMATAHTGETPLVHGQNLKPALDRRIRLMEAHREDIPRIDPDYMEKNAGIPVT